MSTKMQPSRSRKLPKENRALYMDLKEILIEQALRYLPAKTLLRSLTVCKDWRLQIQSPFLAHQQSVSFGSFSGIFVQNRGMPPLFISLDPMAYGVSDPELKFLPEPVDVRASSNGLLCCQGRSAEKALYVCNPANQQWKKLPKPSVDHGAKSPIALVFEPSRMNFIPDYKVVCVFASPEIDEAYEFEIYSSVKDSWKVSAEMYFNNGSSAIGNFTRSISYNGVVHWLSASGKTLDFDTKTEKADGYRGTSSACPGTINGNLCKTSVNGNIVTVSEHTRHSNTMPTSLGARRIKTHNSRLVGMSSAGPLEVLITWDGVVVFKDGNKIYSHDIKTRTTTPLTSQWSGSYYGPRSAVFPYVNSLVNLM